jgi:hypothetical protein
MGTGGSKSKSQKKLRRPSLESHLLTPLPPPPGSFIEDPFPGVSGLPYMRPPTNSIRSTSEALLTKFPLSEVSTPMLKRELRRMEQVCEKQEALFPGVEADSQSDQSDTGRRAATPAEAKGGGLEYIDLLKTELSLRPTRRSSSRTEVRSAVSTAAIEHTVASPPMTPSRRELIDTFIAKLTEAGRKITRKDIWTVAGYKNRTEFERFQRGDARTTRSAIANFERVLGMAPEEFIRNLERRKTPK